MKRLLALILGIVMLLPAAIVPAAAASYPSVSSSKYIEFKAQESINVYKDKACKTRGTSSPSKKYNASIAKNDVCYIYEIDSSYLKVNYPTSSGRRTGFIKRSDLLDKTSAEEYISSAEASVTVHKAQGNSSIAKKDKVWRVDPDKEYSGYYAVIYEAKSGKRAYKLGYVTVSDFSKVKKGAASKVTENTAVTETRDTGSALLSERAKKDAIKVQVFNTCCDMYKDLLDTKKSNARDQIDLVNTINFRLGVEKVLGASFTSVATHNPKAMLSLISADGLIGIYAVSVSESTYQRAEKHHNNFAACMNNVKTAAQADKAFSYFVSALSGYNAVVEANLDTVEYYAKKGNFKRDMLEAFGTAAASAFLPEDELTEVVEICENATTGIDVLEEIDSKWKGVAAKQETISRWYKVWNKLS